MAPNFPIKRRRPALLRTLIQAVAIDYCRKGTVKQKRAAMPARRDSNLAQISWPRPPRSDAWPPKYYTMRNVMEAVVESAITTKGQATIPKAIREHLGLKPGDRVKFFMHPDGSVVLLPKRPASVLRGIVKPRRRPATIKEMSEAAAAGAAADALPRRRR